MRFRIGCSLLGWKSHQRMPEHSGLCPSWSYLKPQREIWYMVVRMSHLRNGHRKYAISLQKLERTRSNTYTVLPWSFFLRYISPILTGSSAQKNIYNGQTRKNINWWAYEAQLFYWLAPTSFWKAWVIWRKTFGCQKAKVKNIDEISGIKSE